jgi:hypothetical protein
MAEQPDIIRRSVGLDYERYVTGALAFDYERLLSDAGYDIARYKRCNGAQPSAIRRLSSLRT